MNYFNKWNEENGNVFTINFIDPFNWNFDLQDNRINAEEKINSMEGDESLLAMIKSVDVFIHEYYANYGMFNLDKNSSKNIYQFGMIPKIDIMLPAFNDIFILTADIIRFDNEIRKKAIADFNVVNKLTPQTLTDIEDVRERNLDKFYSICLKSSFPEFAMEFMSNYKNTRYFWTHNHIAKNFTFHLFFKIFHQLGLKCSSTFPHEILEYDMFANNYTKLTEYDEGYEWGEEIKPLKDYLL